MSSPEEVVRAFCELISKRDATLVEPLLDDGVRYHNIGMAPADGRSATVAALQFQFDLFDPIAFVIVNLAVHGDTVLTERTDEVTANGVMAPVPVMGTFVVRDGKIVEWRDYFDGALAGTLIGGADASALLPRF